MKRLLILLVGVLLFSGCANYNSQHEQELKVLSDYKRFWVKINFDDNHAIGIRIVEELKHRGYEVGSGPLTMMGHNQQVVIEYRDHWAWDFRNHLVAMEIRVSEAKSGAQVATAVYSNSLSLFTSTGDAVRETVRTLFEGKKK